MGERKMTGGMRMINCADKEEMYLTRRAEKL